VDASVLVARAPSGAVVEKRFAAAEMPRLQEAGVVDQGWTIEVRFRFRKVAAHVVIDGVLDGTVQMPCQRCMKAAEIRLHEKFGLILVPDEADLSEELPGYEPIVADPTRVDLHLLAEDQALLALPLVPRHEAEDCAEIPAARDDAAASEGTRHKPFSNLRDMLGDG
jgi:uncharacterized protein